MGLHRIEFKKGSAAFWATLVLEDLRDLRELVALPEQKVLRAIVEIAAPAVPVAILVIQALLVLKAARATLDLVVRKVDGSVSNVKPYSTT